MLYVISHKHNSMSELLTFGNTFTLVGLHYKALQYSSRFQEKLHNLHNLQMLRNSCSVSVVWHKNVAQVAQQNVAYATFEVS